MSLPSGDGRVASRPSISGPGRCLLFFPSIPRSNSRKTPNYIVGECTTSGAGGVSASRGCVRQGAVVDRPTGVHSAQLDPPETASGDPPGRKQTVSCRCRAPSEQRCTACPAAQTACWVGHRAKATDKAAGITSGSIRVSVISQCRRSLARAIMPPAAPLRCQGFAAQE